jgi:hypothetical protein
MTKVGTHIRETLKVSLTFRPNFNVFVSIFKENCSKILRGVFEDFPKRKLLKVSKLKLQVIENQQLAAF